jgi:hypothetical protein
MSESLTYGSVGGPVGQPPALPGTASPPGGGLEQSRKAASGRLAVRGSVVHPLVDASEAGDHAETATRASRPGDRQLGVMRPSRAGVGGQGVATSDFGGYDNSPGLSRLRADPPHSIE